MAQKTNTQMSFSKYYVEKRKTQKVFLQQINQLIDWQPIVCTLAQNYTIGQSESSRKAYPALVLLKTALLQTRYNLSDYGVEDQANDQFTQHNVSVKAGTISISRCLRNAYTS